MSFKEANSMSDAELADVLDFADTVQGWIKSVRAEGWKRAIQRQGCIPGWKIAPGNATRDWAIPPEEIPQRMSAICPAIPYDDYYNKVSISVPQAETMLKQRFKSRGHKKIFDEFNKLVNKATSASTSLVRVTDARPEQRRGQEFLAKIAKTATTATIDEDDLL